MIWQPIRDPVLGCSSFLLGDEVTGVGLVVDALGSVGPDAYILAAQEAGLAIGFVVETHVHADHASAAAGLADALGLPVTLSHKAEASFPMNPVQDGAEIALGSLVVTVWETPGHTPDSVSLIVRDKTRSDDPWLVMTGDSLFVGDVGRPDLVDAEPELIRRAAQDQYESVHRLMTLPDFTELHPAHYGSSPCGGLFMSKKPESTIGYERRTNRMLAIDDPDEFAALQLNLLKPPPPDAARLRKLNLGDPADDAPVTAKRTAAVTDTLSWNSRGVLEDD